MLLLSCMCASVAVRLFNVCVPAFVLVDVCILAAATYLDSVFV